MSKNLQQIIEELKGIPTSTICDSLEVYGITETWLDGIDKIAGAHKTYVGRVKTIQCAPMVPRKEQPLNFYEIIREKDDETIILMAGPGEKSTVMGDNYSVAAKLEGYEAVVCDGLIRDSSTIGDAGIGIFAVGKEGFHGVYVPVAANIPVMFRNCWIVPGDIVAADEDGAILIPVEHAHKVLEHAKKIEYLENKQREIIEHRGSLDELREIFRQKAVPASEE